MNLHRADGASDWSKVSSGQQNRWQRLAATTNGVTTPGNALTVIGIAILIFGLVQIVHQQFAAGAVALIVGRLCDLADGLAAEATGTKSSLGELLDATADKIGTFLTVGVFIYESIAPRWILIVLILPHAFIALAVLYARRKNARVHPSRIGKYSMALAWVSLVGFVLVQAINASPGDALTLSADTLALISFVTACVAALGYVRELRQID